MVTRRIDPAQDQGRNATQISKGGQPGGTPTRTRPPSKAGGRPPRQFSKNQNPGPMPRPPALGGGVRPSEWLFQLRTIEAQRGAHQRAREAQAIGEWLVELAGWLVGRPGKARRRNYSGKGK